VPTVANFRGCGKEVSDFFRTAGWVQASDSGRGNWATLAAVPAQDQYLFEIWKPGDSLTAFYVKIQYGTSQLVLWKANPAYRLRPWRA